MTIFEATMIAEGVTNHQINKSGLLRGSYYWMMVLYGLYKDGLVEWL